jgi:hypothetical protein
VLIERSAAALEVSVGSLEFIVKSAHIYAPDLAAIRAIAVQSVPCSGSSA